MFEYVFTWPDDEVPAYHAQKGEERMQVNFRVVVVAAVVYVIRPLLLPLDRSQFVTRLGQYILLYITTHI